MLDKKDTKPDEEPIEKQDNLVIWDNDNLINAFDLLLRIDMRINPQLYKPDDSQSN